jgi:hypothetical protein
MDELIAALVSALEPHAGPAAGADDQAKSA